MRYEPSATDQAPLPASFGSEPRYLRYRDADLARPYALFFSPTTRPVQPHVVEALARGMAPASDGYGIDDLKGRRSRPGHDGLETGWTRVDGGRLLVCVLTAMPGVTAQMWDWWFGWHGNETARYKQWFPDAHQYAAFGEDRRADRSLTDRQRYVDSVCYVDEYIGGRLHRLAIRFLDPARLGLPAVPGTTHVCARVSLSTAPVAFGWLVHQVRPMDDGVEMRSRFVLNEPQLLRLARPALPPGPVGAVLASRLVHVAGRAVFRPRLLSPLLPDTIGQDLFYHCAAEMNHLASFLARLHEEFRDVP